MNYDNWEEDEQDSINKRRQRQKGDSMRIMVWCLLLGGIILMFSLFMQLVFDIINYFKF
jgi:hypothetical protein